MTEAKDEDPMQRGPTCPEEAPTNKRTHDLDGNEVPGEYWYFLADSFQKDVETFRCAGNDGAVAIASRLVATVDDVPAELIQQQQDFWNVPAEDDLKNIDAVYGKLKDIHSEMMKEIARREYAPVNATVFVTEFIRRVTQAQGPQWWLRSA